jgi:hypothetical protein
MFAGLPPARERVQIAMPMDTRHSVAPPASARDGMKRTPQAGGRGPPLPAPVKLSHTSRALRMQSAVKNGRMK